MKVLKFVHPNNGKPFVSTFELWEGFEYKTHKALKKVVFDHEAEFVERDFRQLELTKVFEKSTGGRKEESILLNERQFILLCLLVKNSPNSVKIKSAIEAEFSALRRMLKDPGRKADLQYKRDTARPMTDALVYIRDLAGKQTDGVPHCSNEHKFCNRALTGRFELIDESSLDAYDLRLLGKIRERNTILIVLHSAQADRRELLDQFVAEYRTRYPKPQLSLVPK